MTSPITLRGLTLSAATDVIIGEITNTSEKPDAIGLEIELLAFRSGSRRRVPLADMVKVLEASAVGTRQTVGGNPRFNLASGGSITLEPGGQVEYATPAFTSQFAVYEDARATTAEIEQIFARVGIELVGVGIDTWNDAEDVPQQLPGPRYSAMAEYLDRRGDWGRVMMRNTGSIQVNLDVRDSNRDQRWRLANLLAPLATATFANSRTNVALNTRAHAWQHMDPTRTGFPDDVNRSSLDAYVDFALDADVLLFWVDDVTAIAGDPGFSFRAWLAQGHPVHGLPTAEALRYHLTTVFPEVRLRNDVIEIRSIDSLPGRWMTVPGVLYAGALYDAHACRELLTLLEPDAADLDARWRRASQFGLADRTIAALATQSWELALDGACRIAAGTDPSYVNTAAAFLDQFTNQGRSPGDNLAQPVLRHHGVKGHTLTIDTRTDRRKHQLRTDLDAIRAKTGTLTRALTDDDLHKQHLSIMSPVVWDMGHVANFEELWLLRELDGRPAQDITRDELYNPFDNPRWCRGDLPILNRVEATEYLNEVRGDAFEILSRADLRSDDPLLRDGYVFDMIAQHEAQHQETILQALDLRPDLDPYGPASHRITGKPGRTDDQARIRIEAGNFTLGTDSRHAAYDNERPRHTVYVETFEIDKYPASSRRFAAFIDTGGYDNDAHWSAEGWAWNEEFKPDAPQGWIRDISGGWLVNRFGHIDPLDPFEPVQHVSYWEAEAFSRWEGGRLLTETEWEKAAAWDPAKGRSRVFPWGDAPPTIETANLDFTQWSPAPVGSLPSGASAYGVHQMIGDVYQWTSSEFAPYPGYSTFPYPEYSEVFFNEGYRVLRGASWATSHTVARNTFRNWDHAVRRQIFSGIRVGWDVR